MTKVKYKHLRKYYGWAFPWRDEIYLNIDMRDKKHLEIIIHELLHVHLPDYSEDAVKRISKSMADTMWKDGYRK